MFGLALNDHNRLVHQVEIPKGLLKSFDHHIVLGQQIGNGGLLFEIGDEKGKSDGEDHHHRNHRQMVEVKKTGEFAQEKLSFLGFEGRVGHDDPPVQLRRWLRMISSN
jgi:hypothetical protein